MERVYVVVDLFGGTFSIHKTRDGAEEFIQEEKKQMNSGALPNTLEIVEWVVNP